MSGTDTTTSPIDMGVPEIGAIAQLGERYNGIVEVSGSIPLGSTTTFPSGASSSIHPEGWPSG